MIVVPGKFVYVGSPRTGSRYIYNVLEKHFANAERWHEHHAFPRDVMAAKQRNGGIPIFSVVRDPCDQLYSLYLNSLRKYPDRKVTTTFREFIEGRRPPNAPYNKGQDFPPGALCLYRDVADKFFKFEPNFTTLFKHLEIGHEYDIERDEDLYDSAKKKPNSADRALVYKLFKKDYDVLRRLG